MNDGGLVLKFSCLINHVSQIRLSERQILKRTEHVLVFDRINERITISCSHLLTCDGGKEYFLALTILVY